MSSCQGWPISPGRLINICFMNYHIVNPDSPLFRNISDDYDSDQLDAMGLEWTIGDRFKYTDVTWLWYQSQEEVHFGLQLLSSNGKSQDRNENSKESFFHSGVGCYEGHGLRFREIDPLQVRSWRWWRWLRGRKILVLTASDDWQHPMLTTAQNTHPSSIKVDKTR